MRLFLYEYLCAGGHGGSSSLRREGWAMLSALVADFRTLPDVHVTTLLDLEAPKPLGQTCYHIDAAREAVFFRELTAASDAVLLIAPECDDILEQRSRWVLDAGVHLLGSRPDAVALTADKFALAFHLAARGIPTPRTQSLDHPDSFPAVLKPISGAGSQATFLIRAAAELPAALDQARTEWPGPLLLQTFHAGQPASICFLVGPGLTIPLLPAAQNMSSDGRFRYEGGTLPLSTEIAQRAIALGQRAVASVPGLQGFVGVDLVLGDDGDVVVEINPRPTTSYIGLRRLSTVNLAQAFLDVLAGTPPGLSWLPGPLHFTPDG